MSDDPQNIEHGSSTKTPNPEVVKAMNALWTLLHKTAEKIDSYNEVKQQNIEYTRALEQMKSDKSGTSVIIEEHEDLKRKYQYLINIHIPEIEKSLIEERNKSDKLDIENAEIQKELESEILTSQNFGHAQKELARKNHELNSRAEQILKLKEEIANLESKVLDLENKHRTLMQKDSIIDELNSQIVTLKKEIELLKNQNDESTGVIEVLKTDLIEQEEDFSLKLGEISEKYNDMEKQYNDLMNNYTLLESEKEKIVLSIENLEKINSELETKNLEYSEVSEKYFNKIEKMQDEKDRIISALEEQIKLLEIERNDNENQIRTNLETISKIEYKLNRLIPDHEHLKDNLIECQECLDRNQKALEKSKNLEKDIEVVRNELIIKENIIKGLKNSIDSLQSYKIKCSEYEKKVTKLNNSFEDKDSEIWNLNNELETLKNKSDRDKNKLKEMAFRIEKLYQKINDKDKDIKSNYNTISDLKTKVIEHEQRKKDFQQMKSLFLDKINTHLPKIEELLDK